MNSVSSELGVQFGTSLEAPHVIDVESQVMDFSYFLVSWGLVSAYLDGKFQKPCRNILVAMNKLNSLRPNQRN